MFEIELILNNRPLREIYDDDVEEVLTPNHLLFGRRLESTNFNDSNFNPDAPSIPYRYKHLNKITSGNRIKSLLEKVDERIFSDYS